MEESVLKEMLASRDFRLLLSGQYLAQAADGLALAAFAEVLVLEPFEAETPGRILELFVLTLVPYSIIAPFLGVFVDRWQRRRLLVWTNLIRGAFLASLPLLALALPGNYDLYASQVVLLGFGRLFLTTKGAVLPAVLHEHHLLRGNAVSGGGGMIAALLGGVAGVGAVGALDEEWAFVIAGVLYIAASAIVTRLSEPYLAPHASEEALGEAFARIARELLDGLHAIRARVRVLLPLIGIFLLRTIGILVAIGAILVIKQEFPEGTDRTGRLGAAALSLASAGVGAFVGAITAPFLGRRFVKPQLILLGFIVSGAGIIALGGISNIPAVLGLTFFGGYGGFVTKVAVDAQVQEALPDHYRGRVFALYDVLYNMASVTAAFLMYAFQDVSLRPLFVTSGSIAFVLALVLGAAMARAGMLAQHLTAEEVADI
jgi:MFS family permease